MDIVEKKLGQLLKLERERRQLSLSEISTDLKIPEHNLEGIEKGDLSLLPSVIYYNLFARSYAQHLGIDYVRTLDAIRMETEKASAESVSDEVVLHGGAAEEDFDESETEQSQSKMSNMKLAGFLAIALLLAFSYVAIDKLFLADAANHNGASYMLKGIDENRLVSFSSFDWGKAAPTVPGDIKLRLIPRAESWGTVLSDGDTAIFRRLVPGRVYEASAKYRHIVSIGIPSAVDVEINGKLVDIRDEATRRISRVEINQINLDSFLNRTERGNVESKPAPTFGAASHENLQGHTISEDTGKSQNTANQDER